MGCWICFHKILLRSENLLATDNQYHLLTILPIMRRGALTFSIHETLFYGSVTLNVQLLLQKKPHFKSMLHVDTVISNMYTHIEMFILLESYNWWDYEYDISDIFQINVAALLFNSIYQGLLGCVLFDYIVSMSTFYIVSVNTSLAQCNIHFNANFSSMR
jgi:hypothetical protein